MNPICPTHGVIDGSYRLSQSDLHEPVTTCNPREMKIKQLVEKNIRITERNPASSAGLCQDCGSWSKCSLSSRTSPEMRAAMNFKIALTILVWPLTASVPAQNRASDFQITKITRDLITTPQFNYSGAEQQHDTHERWLRVDVQFSAFPELAEELTFKYYILINGKLLTGEVTHVNVLAGKEHYSVMYVPPHALASIMQNRPPNSNSVENIAVQLLQKGEVKDELSLNRARPQWYASLPALTGVVLNKNETPFAPLFWDHYEQIKPAGR